MLSTPKAEEILSCFIKCAVSSVVASMTVKSNGILVCVCINVCLHSI